MRHLFLALVLNLAVSHAALPARAAAAGQPAYPQLTDITEKAGISFVHSMGDDSLSNIVESTGAGVCFLDYDSDGYIDFYLVNGSYRKEVNHPGGRAKAGLLRNALYRNNGDGTFTDVTEKAGVGDTGYGMGCVSADYDNDGRADLYVTNYGPNVLYRNNGDGTFTDVTAKAGVGCALWSTGATFLDYDRDGLLDLYVGNYLQYDPDYHSYYKGDAFPGPLSYRGQPDVLYRNRGDGTFEDVTRAAGLYNPRGRAMGVTSGDVDGDGDMDIFVANDAMENFLYLNNGDGTFTEAALPAGVAFGQNGEATSAMGPDFGDFDGDGLMDILVPDMRYSCLYRNTGGLLFREMSAITGLASACGQYTGWSGNFLDFDNDGLPDIFISTGDSHFLKPEGPLLLHNEGGRRLSDISRLVGPDFQRKFVGRGAATADIDNDGDLDILILNLNARPRLLRNDGGNKNHWLMVRAKGSRSNRDAVGTRIRLTAGGKTQVREVRSGSGYLSQGDFRVHFGMGRNVRAEKIEVRWPDGRTEVLQNVAADKILTVSEPEDDEK
jgi:hypothetical protein